MKLYYTNTSPYARKVRIIALEKDIDLRLIEEDLRNKSDELTFFNPIGRIPALHLDSGDVLCDSPLICEYLDSLNANSKFVPENSEASFKIRNLAAIADGLMDVTVDLYKEQLRHKDDLNVAFVKAAEATVKRCLQYCENHINEFKEFHLASVGLICAVGYIQLRQSHLFDEENSPEVYDWYQEHLKRESVQSTMPIN